MSMATLPHHAFGTDPKAEYRDWLVEKCRDLKNVAEVGAFAGTTTLRLAKETGARIFAVDHWRGVPGDPLQADIYRNLAKTRRLFHKRLGPFIKRGRVEVLEMDSMAAAQTLGKARGRFLDLAFIDADHSYDAVRSDIWAWQQVVKPGGILCGHDINWPGVLEAVKEYFPKWQRGGGFIWWTEVP